MMITHRARVSSSSSFLSLSLSLCVCCERESERERDSRSSSTIWKTRFVLFQVGVPFSLLGKHREKKKRDKKSGIRKTRARDIYTYNNALSLKIQRDKRERERDKKATRDGGCIDDEKPRGGLVLSRVLRRQR